MKSRKYCIIVLDNVKGVKLDLAKVTTEPLTFVDSENGSVLVCKFDSQLEPANIKEILNSGLSRSFFLFELDPKTCAVHIDNDYIHDFIFKTYEESVENDEPIDGIDSESDYINEAQLLSLTEAERNVMIDNLLIKVSSLTNKDKKILNFLASL